MVAPSDGIARSVVVRNVLEFLSPIRYSIAPVEVHLWVPRIGRASTDIHSEVWSEAHDPEQVRSVIAITTIVFTDAATGRVRAISAAERVALEALYDEPLTVRSRPFRTAREWASEAQRNL